MLRRAPLRLLALACLLLALTLQPFVGPPATRAAVTQVSGSIPWHPHDAVTFASGLTGSVDLADGHFDLGLAGMQLAGRGLPLTFAATWDSTLALAGTSSIAGQGSSPRSAPK